MNKKDLINKITNNMFLLADKYGKPAVDGLIKSCCIGFENVTGEFCGYRNRTKKPSEQIVKSVATLHGTKVAIVIQGPIMEEDKFTLETIKWYRKMYPDIIIILSTWEDAAQKAVDEIQKLKVEVIKNKRPESSGLGNINFQAVSSKVGVKAALDAGAEYVLKTRTDQRIYRRHFLEFFLSLISTHKLTKQCGNQQERIIYFQGTVDGNMFIPYFMSDFLYFGRTDDIRRLFDIDMDMSVNVSKDERRKDLKKLVEKNPSIIEYYNETAPEIRIIKNYIKKYISSEIDDSVYSYWNFVKNYCICISWDDIELFWPKYNRYAESRMSKTYRRDDSVVLNSAYCWTYNNWLMLQNGYLKYSKDLEDICQKSVKELEIKL